MIQFRISAQFKWRKSSLSKIQFSKINQINCQIIIFQTFPLSINTQFSSIWRIDGTLSEVTTLGLSEPGIKGYFTFPNASALPEPYRQIV